MARMRVGDPSFTKWVGVLQQGPMQSSIYAFPIENMAHMTPTASRPRTGLQAGDRAPDFELTCTDERVIHLEDFRGKPLVLRLTRAVTERII